MEYTKEQLLQIQKELENNSESSPLILITPHSPVSVLTRDFLKGYCSKISLECPVAKYYPSTIGLL
jgi:hypothetical protein